MIQLLFCSALENNANLFVVPLVVYFFVSEGQ